MTISISDNNPRIAYTATAGQTAFTVPFEFFSDSDLNVYINETLKTITTHYTVSGGSGSTGTVTLTSGATLNDKVVITRDVTLERTTDFPASGPFQVSSLNTELDKIIAMIADLEDLASRGITLSDSDTDVSVTLPNVTGRAGKVLAFNSTTGAVEAGPTITATQTVADQAADIETCADNISAITDAPTQATNAANSATSAAASATTATTKASEASTSASNASTSETNAASSATSAATSATTATTKASEASTSATNAASSATTATTKASEAATSATNASTSASTATTKASEAATSATNAAASATTATTKATEAASSATAAASSATAAASSQTAAAASAASAASAFDNFDDTYLGSKSSDPTVDNDGDALTSGDLYFNSTANEMRVYDGANWIAATSAGNVSLILYEYTATAGQTTFSGSDDNSATLSYTVDNLQVVMNGVVLDPADFTATNGTSVVLDSGATVGDQINIYAFKSFTTADMVSKTAGGTFSGAVGFSGGITGDVTIDDKIVHAGDTNTSIRFPAADTVTIETGGSERARVASDGKVGIGITSPEALTHIAGATADADGSLGSQSPQLIIEGGNNNNPFEIGMDNSGATAIAFLQSRNKGAGAQYLSLNPKGGNVGIGLATPTKTLDVRGTQLISADGNYRATNSGALNISPNSNMCIGYGGDSDANYYAGIFHNSSNTAVGSIFVDATSTTYATSSDHRLKENVADLTGAIDRVKTLAPKRFNFIADPDTTVDGFLAHEVTAVPEAIVGTHNQVDDDDNPVYQGIDQAKLVPLLTAALQEAIAKIETLETKVAALEAE